MKRAGLLLSLLLAACGGGGGASSSNGASGTVVSAPALRTDLLYGYYGENASAVTETADHTNLVWAADFYGPAQQAATLIQARAMGERVVLMVPAYNDVDDPLPASSIRLYLQNLASANLLWGGIVAIYPKDEPQLDPAVIRAQNAVVRSVVAEFPAIAGAKLAVIYACKAGFPGADSYDLIGCDDYDSGCAVFARYYGALEAANPQAQLLDVPGGAAPWRQDPACFESHAHGTPKVWALVPFIWQTAGGHAGIREDAALRPLYCAAGRKITGASLPC